MYVEEFGDALGVCLSSETSARGLIPQRCNKLSFCFRHHGCAVMQVETPGARPYSCSRNARDSQGNSFSRYRYSESQHDNTRVVHPTLVHLNRQVRRCARQVRPANCIAEQRECCIPWDSSIAATGGAEFGCERLADNGRPATYVCIFFHIHLLIQVDEPIGAKDERDVDVPTGTVITPS